MTTIESRQVRRARSRAEAQPSTVRATHPKGNRLARRSVRPDDKEIIVRPTSLNAVRAIKRSRRDFRIRKELRPARGAVHPRTISGRRYFAIQLVALTFAVAAKRAETRRAAAV